MFTGLVETTGTILAITPSTGTTRITVAAPATLAARLRTGDSVAVNGVCLTALDIQPAAAPSHFSADLAAETIHRTTLARLHPGSTVNLELPTPAGAPLGGHVVQGHVDGTATLTALTALNPTSPETTDWRLHLSLPEDLAQNVIPQGSVTVEGISLTVAALRRTPAGADIEIAVIPHTWNSTSLQTLKPGDPVNIETDVLARYAAQRAAPSPPKPEWLTASYLLANGY